MIRAAGSGDPTPDAAPFDPTVLAAGRLVARLDGAVLRITLNAPEIRNAQLPATWEALAHIGSRLPTTVRVVVLGGAGTSFSAGLDRSSFGADPDALVAQLARMPPAVGEEQIRRYQDGFGWLADPSFVSIAAVQGHAVGAGFQLALACDLILAADDARFRMAEVSLGLVPDLGGSRRLVRLIGGPRALEICATGRVVGAEEAVRIGLALAAVPVAELAGAVDALVKALLANDVDAVRAVTRLVLGAADRDLEEQRTAEANEQLLRLQALAGR